MTRATPAPPSKAMLPSPSVTEAEGNSLPSTAPFATVVVPADANLQDHDLLIVKWEGVAGVGTVVSYPLPIIGAAAGKPYPYKVKAPAIAANAGRTVKVSYDVVRGPSTIPSNPFVVQVDDARMAGAPEIPLALGNVVYMGEIPSDGLPVQVPVYEGMAAGQKLRIRCVGEQTQEFGPIDVTGVVMQTIAVPKTYWEVEAAPSAPAVAVTYIVTELGTSRALIIAPRPGAAPTSAPPPTVTGVIGGKLPVDATHVTNIVPAAANLVLGDILTVSWSGASGVGSPAFGTYTIREEHLGKNFVTGEATSAAIAANRGRSVKVDYTVTHPGRPKRKSERYDFRVG
ncbi:MAG TPA: hypothetical protein VM621_00585 [Luteibacter sp.]|uniref:hypothetical protein n=1 Tax=Luteibacter sp. TaxID=1886636 RepID=UPI002CB4DC05|nr:hypothetical protein [Luteibacter sp.]HVI53531.1 hypothetical protein [Luteibacter sp.]